MILISAQAFPPSSGGIQTLMAGLASAASENYPVHVLADGKRDATDFDKTAAVSYRVTRFGGIKPLRRRVKAKAVTKICADNKVSHVFCDSWKSAEHLSPNLTCPVIVYAHGNEFPCEGDADYAAKTARIKNALSKASVMIAVSHDTKKRATPFLPMGFKAEVIHNPVDAPLLPSAFDHDIIDALWPQANKIRCLVLCRLIDWKGVDMAIRAVAARDDCQLIIAGTGDDRRRLEALTTDLKAQERIHFIGRIEGRIKSALFDSADIFLQPGRRVGDQCEGYGITYIEAALHGLPAISGDEGGAPEAVINGETAFVVNAEKLENIMPALASLAENANIRSEMSKKAIAHATGLLWHKQIDRILTVVGN